MVQHPGRIPVIIGVGQINDRPAEPALGLNSLGLMEAALRRADADAGGGWLSALDSLAIVNQISWPSLGDFSTELAQNLGSKPSHLEITKTAGGHNPVRLLNEAAIRIGAGEIDCAAVVGGEALRTAAGHKAKNAGGNGPVQSIVHDFSARRSPEYRARYGLLTPVDVYPLYENALRARLGQTLQQGQDETSQIWSIFSETAAENEGAWIRYPLTPEEIMTPSADNRRLAFPYTKRMVANMAVNQGAAFIVTSLSMALARGMVEENFLYVGYGAAAHEPEDVLARDGYDHSQSMAVSLRRALSFNDLAVDDLDCVELYSCFPCVPKIARRVINWPIDRPATVFGGLTFGGGPIGNYMSHAVVSMVQRLRKTGQHGLLFGNGGLATHNHSIVISRKAITGTVYDQCFDVQSEADLLRNPAPTLQEEYAGPATIETYTVFFDRDGAPLFGTIVARTANGARTLAKVPADDKQGIAHLIDGLVEPVGSRGHIVRRGEEQIWELATRRGASPLAFPDQLGATR